MNEFPGASQNQQRIRPRSYHRLDISAQRILEELAVAIRRRPNRGNNPAQQKRHAAEVSASTTNVKS